MRTTTLFRNSTEFQTFHPGDIVFKAGDPGDCMYVIKEGEVDLLIEGKALATLGEGEVFGEMAIVDSKPRSATAVAKTNCQLVPVNEKRFNFLVQQTPYFAIFLIQVLADRLRGMDEKFRSPAAN
ncbi:MAG: cyclic nucleotide-binding domain-containing protein [Verrucomicrobiota bacterium]